MKIKLFILALALALTSCADSVPTDPLDTVGFFHGIWHGMITPISFICSWFNDDVVIYAAYNNGFWYDLGFLMGVGGSSCSCASKRS